MYKLVALLTFLAAVAIIIYACLTIQVKPLPATPEPPSPPKLVMANPQVKAEFEAKRANAKAAAEVIPAAEDYAKVQSQFVGEAPTHIIDWSQAEDHGLCLAVSPDGKWLLSEVKEQKCFAIVNLSGDTVRWVTKIRMHPFGSCFSPDGKYLVARSDEGIHLFNAVTGDATGMTKGGITLCFSNDSKLLAVATDNGVKLIETATGNDLRTLPRKGDENECFELRFSDDNSKLLCIRAFFGAVSVWDVVAGKVLSESTETSSRLFAWATFDGSGMRFQGKNRSIVAEDLEGTVLATNALTGYPASMCALSDGSAFALGMTLVGPQKEGAIRIFTSGKLDRWWDLAVPGGCPEWTSQSLAISPDRQYLAANILGPSNRPSYLVIYSLRIGKEVKRFGPFGRNDVIPPVFAGNGQMLLGGPHHLYAVPVR